MWCSRSVRRRFESIALGSAALLLLAAVAAPPVDAQQLYGPIPAPPENPLTDEKALLGKFLFWEEQLSADDTVACGTCHRPSAGGTDPRAGGPFSIHPGSDAKLDTEDDVHGSIGLVARDCDGRPVEGDGFAPLPQVTRRRAGAVIAAGLAELLFWDGRAGDTFYEPDGEDVVIESGGALEVQALAPILSPVEMGCEGRTWVGVTAKLEAATPLLYAADLPQAMAEALTEHPTYPDLFELAFGDAEITPVRIAFAIASYERTLLPDAAPFDEVVLGNYDVMTPDQNAGFALFEKHCMSCHVGFELSDHAFRNIGVAPAEEDGGRAEVTGDDGDRGKFKTPTLRNAALRAPYFHDGSAATIEEVLDFYNRGGDFSDNVDTEMVPLDLDDKDLGRIQDFIENVLTDPRVALEEPPFDAPRLRRFFRRGDVNGDLAVAIDDAVALLEALFLEGERSACEDAADGNDDGVLDVADPIFILEYLFQSGEDPAAPGALSFGPDPTLDLLDCADADGRAS